MIPLATSIAPRPAADPLAQLPQRIVPIKERVALPMSRREMEQRGWDEIDVVFVIADFA